MFNELERVGGSVDTLNNRFHGMLLTDLGIERRSRHGSPTAHDIEMHHHAGGVVLQDVAVRHP
jgi:hypothetical protein